MLDMNLLNKFNVVKSNVLLPGYTNYIEYDLYYNKGTEREVICILRVSMDEYNDVSKVTFIGEKPYTKVDKSNYSTMVKMEPYCTFRKGVYMWKEVPTSLVEEFLKEILEKNN